MARRSSTASAVATATATVATPRTTILSEEDVQRIGRAIRTCLSCAKRDVSLTTYADGSPKSPDKRRFEADHLRRMTEIAAAFRYTTGFDAFAAVEESSNSHEDFMHRMGF